MQEPDYIDWLLWANYDLKTSQILLQQAEILVPPLLYHSQQCAEKSFKAYLCFKKQFIPKTHDLPFLAELCEKFDNEFNNLIAAAVDLDPYITSSRYPDKSFLFPDATTATILFKKSENIFNFVNNKCC